MSEYIFFPLDEDIDICTSCPIDIGKEKFLKRTLESLMKLREKSNTLATFSCTHKVTGRPICAVPCDGILELCEDDADEKCEGPWT